MTLLPTMQSCAICAETINKQLFPISVIPPPPDVPGLMVTYSLIVLLSPIIVFELSPVYLRSCGILMETNGKNLLFFPIIVFPKTLTWDCMTVLLPISTLGPIIE